MRPSRKRWTRFGGAEYQALRGEALTLARTVAVQNPPDTRYIDAFVDAYTDRLMAIWHGLVKRQDRDRSAWKRALTGLTVEQAVDKVQKLVEGFHIRGICDGDMGRYDGLTVTVERSWGVNADLYIRYERTDDKTTNPDNSNESAGTYRFTTSISWSSTGRSLAQATASVKLYQELIEVAAEVEAVMKEDRVIWTWGIPEPVRTDRDVEVMS